MNEKEKRIQELKAKIFDLDMKDSWDSLDPFKWLAWHRELRELEKGE